MCGGGTEGRFGIVGVVAVPRLTMLSRNQQRQLAGREAANLILIQDGVRQVGQNIQNIYTEYHHICIFAYVPRND